MGYLPTNLPSLRVAVFLVLATVILVNTSTANATLCASLSCVDVSTAACKFCNRRVGKRSENYAWGDGRDQDNTNDRETMTSECYLDNAVASLPHDVQEQLFEVLEVVLGMNR